MKQLFALLLFFSFSQPANSQKKTYVRVFDVHGNKIGNGYVLGTTDSTLLLKNGGKDPTVLKVDGIGILKTKHSAWNNVLKGSLIGAGALAISGTAIALADPDGVIVSEPPGEAALSGLVVGSVVGGVIGALTAIFKNPEMFVIYGDAKFWADFRSFVTEGKLPGQ